MDEIQKLLELAGADKAEEAKKLAEAISAKIKKLDEDVIAQERLKLDAISTRDKTKEQNRSLLRELGVDDNEKAVQAITDLKAQKDNSTSSEADKKEIAQLKAEIETASQTLKDTKSAHQKELLGLSLQKDVATILPTHKAKAAATPYLIKAIQEKATYEDGKVLFRNPDGTTLRVDGRDATLDDVVKQMRETEVKSKQSMFFDIGVEPSGRGDNKGGAPSEGDFVPGQSA